MYVMNIPCTFHTYLYHEYRTIGPHKVLSLRDWVDLGAMAINGYFAFYKASVYFLCHIYDTHSGILTLLPRCCRCILLLRQLTRTTLILHAI